MKKEIYFRKQQDEAARLIAEAKALAKKKKWNNKLKTTILIKFYDFIEIKDQLKI